MVNHNTRDLRALPKGHLHIHLEGAMRPSTLAELADTAGIPVMVEWSENVGGGVGTLVVPSEKADFAWAVVNEIDVDDEVPDTSPHAYVARIEEHLSAAAELLDELRTRLDELDNDSNA